MGPTGPIGPIGPTGSIGPDGPQAAGTGLSWNARWEGAVQIGLGGIPIAYGFGASGVQSWKCPFDGALWSVQVAQDSAAVPVIFRDIIIDGVSLSGAGAFTAIPLGADVVDSQAIPGYPILEGNGVTVEFESSGKAFVTVNMIFQNITV